MLAEPTTGWERDVAVGDTLLRRYLVHHAAAADVDVRPVAFVPLLRLTLWILDRT